MSKKTLSPKLIEIRDGMICGHCETHFKASDSQALHFYYEQVAAYCSPECKSLGMGKKISKIRTKPKKLFGPCPTCRKKFASKDPRVYCSLPCWLESPEFKLHLTAISRKGTEAHKQKCLDARPLCPVCKVNQVKPGNTFCSKQCWRIHYAELFDHQIANPVSISELQGFDEYMSQAELPCLVEGCGWKGGHLSVHLNHAHGITAGDFKRLVGFNLGTGLVAPSMKGHMVSTHEHTGLSREDFLSRVASKQSGEENRERYVSKESQEHRAKARALRRALPED